MKGYLVCFLLGVAAALSLSLGNHYYLFPAALAGLALADRRAYRIFLRWKLWLFFLLVVAIPVVVVAPRDAEWIGINYTATMLRLNLLMVERSILLMLSLKMLTGRISPFELSRSMKRAGLAQFDEVFRLSQKMLPGLRTTVTLAFREVAWRRTARHPSQLIALLSRLVAGIVYSARHSALPVMQEELE